MGGERHSFCVQERVTLLLLISTALPGGCLDFTYELRVIGLLNYLYLPFDRCSSNDLLKEAAPLLQQSPTTTTLKQLYLLLSRAVFEAEDNCHLYQPSFSITELVSS